MGVSWDVAPGGVAVMVAERGQFGRCIGQFFGWTSRPVQALGAAQR
jgi:hypothetical protein